MNGMLSLCADDDFWFDDEAADRACRFVEKFCILPGGDLRAERPFVLAPIQRTIIGDIYGWKWRAGPRMNRRRFTDVYWEGPIGCGKSPTLAALGIYSLIGGHQRDAQVYSLASTYQQAKVVFETAQKFIERNGELARRLEVIERQIRHRPSGSRWDIVSGKGPGSGRSPSVILGDELHEWSGPGAYDQLRDRMIKTPEPLLIAATNAPESRASFCWMLRERAINALNGHGPPTLYPIIWAATLDEEEGESIRTDDPEAWRKANPMLGITIQEHQVREHMLESMKDKTTEVKARRLYLGLTPKGGVGRWLNLSMWDKCESEEPAPKDATEYIGLDLSQVDDLCAAAFIQPTPEKVYVGCHFWMPRSTAEHYAEQNGIPYLEWAEKGHITLVDDLTITDDVLKEIARAIIARSKTRKVKAVCYDRYKASVAIADIEAASLTCVPVPQGYTLSPGCAELERLLKQGDVSIWPNPVLRWCAENTEVYEDQRGNFWPIKPNAKGKFAGTRALKIDGITALVTAMTESRKHKFPKTGQSKAKAYVI
jgi:phage terminase large subunit-like protein